MRNGDRPDDREVVCSPRPPGAGRRVALDPGAAPKRARRRTDDSVRETDGRASRRLCRASAQELHYRRLAPRARFDAFASGSAALPQELRRSRIVEVLACDDVLFSLAHCGLCTAFCRDTHRRLAVLNASAEEIIRSIFFNKPAGSLITVSVTAGDNFASLLCRSTPVHRVRAGEPGPGTRVFGSHSLQWPGFVELDDVNNVCLTYSATTRTYRVHDLCRACAGLYSVPDVGIQEVKLSPGILLLVHERRSADVALKLLCVKTGALLTSMTLPLQSGAKIVFIEPCNDSVLMQQEGAPLVIVDARTGATRSIPGFATPSATIFLHESQSFLALQAGTLAVYSLRGACIARFENHTFRSDSSANNLFVSADQTVLCMAAGDASQAVIHVSDILTGRSLAQLRLAAEDVTALLYDEERGELLLGSRGGCVSVWGS